MQQDYSSEKRQTINNDKHLTGLSTNDPSLAIINQTMLQLEHTGHVYVVGKLEHGRQIK